MKTQNMFVQKHCKAQYKKVIGKHRKTRCSVKNLQIVRDVSHFFLFISREFWNHYITRNAHFDFLPEFSQWKIEAAACRRRVAGEAQTRKTLRHVTEQEPSSRSFREKCWSEWFPCIQWGGLAEKRERGYPKAFPRAILGCKVAFRVHQMQQRRYLDPPIWCFRREGFTEHEKHKTCFSKTL